MNHDLPLPWKLRSDLVISPSEGDAFIVKDPLRLQYFRMRAEEIALLQLLDGRSTWGDLVGSLKQRFRERQFSETNLVSFLTNTINNSLLVSSNVGHGDRVASINTLRSKMPWHRRLASSLTYRWHGIDPTKLLDIGDSLFGTLLSPRSLIAIGFLLATVTIALLLQLPIIAAELPTVGQLTTTANLPYLLAAFVFVKLCHELGHGIACRHYGGECHELGILFIAFFPLLYCDVSDAWLFRQRWKRILVSSAGILVELVLASVFAVLWLLSVPGTLHTFFLNVFLVASINTLIINGNPLLRYDGYYVLADALGLPNLGPESRRAAAHLFDRIVLGIPRERVAASAIGELAFCAFGVASALYKIFVLALILWVVDATLRPHGLELIAQVLALSMAVGIGVSGLQAVRHRANSIDHQSRQRPRAILGLLVLIGLTIAGLAIPLPRTVSAPITMTAGTSTPFYVTAPGKLVSIVSSGEFVQQGDVIARLSNPELDMAIVRAEGTVRQTEKRLQLLLDERSENSEIAATIPTIRQSLAAAETQLETLRRQASQLVIRTDRSGYVFPPRQIDPPISPPGELQQRPFQTPLDSTAIGAWLPAQTQLCWIGNASDAQPVASVEETAIPFIKQSASVEAVFASAPGSIINGNVATVSSRPQEMTAPELYLTGALAPPAQAQPLANRYRIDIELQASMSSNQSHVQIPTPLYSTGTARIECDPESISSRLWRLICHTFAIQAR